MAVLSGINEGPVFRLVHTKEEVCLSEEERGGEGREGEGRGERERGERERGERERRERERGRGERGGDG
jgi:hypothetical protein